MINYTAKHSGINEEIEKQGYTLFRLNGDWLSNNDIEVQKIIDSFDDVAYLRAEAKLRVKNQVESLMIGVQQSYPAFELQTWPYQRLEIEAYDLDNSAPTTTIDEIAAARQVSRDSQLERTRIKVAEFKQQSNHLTGRRQYHYDLINESTDIDYLTSINFEA